MNTRNALMLAAGDSCCVTRAGEWRAAQVAMAMQSLDGDSAVPGAAMDSAAVSLTGQCLRARAVAAGHGCAAPIDCQQVCDHAMITMRP